MSLALTFIQVQQTANSNHQRTNNIAMSAFPSIGSVLTLFIFLISISSINSLAPSKTPSINPNFTSDRSTFLHKALTAGAAGAATVLIPSPSIASDTNEANGKLYNLSPDEIAAVVKKDLLTNAFLTNGKLTRSIYDEKATFTDEIDTYTLDKWIVGTSRLFVGPPYSRVDLVGDVQASEKEIVFRFDEDLMFNIPLIRPVVSLTGKVVLERDEKSGLITSYREFWDQDVNTVLKSAKLFN
mmetsp:Transcript_17887/g.26146  ORF Transcript_17887/g.26146 Transcript_17887/m.26146 type:complete len:241 (-) Transcript_17887:89-811(-)